LDSNHRFVIQDDGVPTPKRGRHEQQIPDMKCTRIETHASWSLLGIVHEAGHPIRHQLGYITQALPYPSGQGCWQGPIAPTSPKGVDACPQAKGFDLYWLIPPIYYLNVNEKCGSRNIFRSFEFFEFLKKTPTLRSDNKYSWAPCCTPKVTEKPGKPSD
jgi:hypothetical protein